MNSNLTKDDIYTDVYNGGVDLLQKYLDNGGDPDIIDEEGDTTLLMLTPVDLDEENDGYKIAKMLIDAGAKVNYRDKRGETALSIAVTYQKPSIVKLLLDSGADTSFKYNNQYVGETIIDIAEEMERYFVIKSKEEQEPGEDINIYSKEEIATSKLITRILKYHFDKKRKYKKFKTSEFEWGNFCANLTNYGIRELLDLTNQLYKEGVAGRIKFDDKFMFEKKLKRLLCYFLSISFTQIRDNDTLKLVSTVPVHIFHDKKYDKNNKLICETTIDNDEKVDLNMNPLNVSPKILVYRKGNTNWCFSLNDVQGMLRSNTEINPFTGLRFTRDELLLMRNFVNDQHRNSSRIKLFKKTGAVFEDEEDEEDDDI